MRTNIVVTDQFYEDPHAVREWALRQRYYYPYQSDADVRSGRRPFTWMTSWFRDASDCPFKSSPVLIRALERITGDTVDLDHWRSGFPIDSDGKPLARRDGTSCLWNCSFHFKPDLGERGQGIHNHVTDHWNSVGTNGWAGLVYLSEEAPLRAGLRLWRNLDRTRNFDWMTPAENWEMTDDIGNLFNRLILCRGDLPHSGASGWHDQLEHGRLYQTFFFRVAKDPVRPNIRLKLPDAVPHEG